jgi:phosphoglycerol transferase MdoB-like AlkP superfamily enzyme
VKHPLLALAATRPLLLAAHAEAYAALAAAELAEAGAGWQRRCWLGALAIGGVMASVVLTGVAVLSWAMWPDAAAQVPWALAGVPLAPLALALGCLVAAGKAGPPTAFGRLRQQLRADLLMLREAGGP